MIYVAAFLACLVVALILALIRQSDRNVADHIALIDSFRAERAELINKIANPQAPMSTGRPAPKVTPRRTPENAREYARVGTVARPMRENGEGYSRPLGDAIDGEL